MVIVRETVQWRASPCAATRAGRGVALDRMQEKRRTMDGTVPARDGAVHAKGYREQVLTVEPHGIERIAADERHGSARTLFSLWLAANMGLPVWLVGALAVGLGLGFADGVAAVVVGNLIGCTLLALT